MSASDTIPIGGTVKLVFLARNKRTGEIIPDAIITDQQVSLTNPSIASFVQDTTNPNIFHFTGLSGGTTDINCTAVISL